MNEAHPPRRTLRSIGAVLAGLLAVVALDTGIDAVMHATGVYPPWGQSMAGALFLLAMAYRMVDGIAGSYIAARLAPARPMRHALILGFIGVAASLSAPWPPGTRARNSGPTGIPSPSSPSRCPAPGLAANSMACAPP